MERSIFVLLCWPVFSNPKLGMELFYEIPLYEGNDLANLKKIQKWQPTPVFLPGESQGRGSLVGCRLWGRTESDTTEAT